MVNLRSPLFRRKRTLAKCGLVVQARTVLLRAVGDGNFAPLPAHYRNMAYDPQYSPAVSGWNLAINATDKPSARDQLAGAGRHRLPSAVPVLSPSPMWMGYRVWRGALPCRLPRRLSRTRWASGGTPTSSLMEPSWRSAGSCSRALAEAVARRRRCSCAPRLPAGHGPPGGRIRAGFTPRMDGRSIWRKTSAISSCKEHRHGFGRTTPTTENPL